MPRACAVWRSVSASAASHHAVLPDTTESSPQTSPSFTRRARHHTRRLERIHSPRLARSSRSNSTNSPNRSTATTQRSTATPHLRHGDLSGGRRRRKRPRPQPRKSTRSLQARPPRPLFPLWMLLAGRKTNPGAALLPRHQPRPHREIEQGRVPARIRDREFRGAAWLYGGLWEFGGRTTWARPSTTTPFAFPRWPNVPAAASRYRPLYRRPRHQPYASTLHRDWPGTKILSTSSSDRRLRHSPLRCRRSSRPAAPGRSSSRPPYSYRAEGNKDHGDADASQDSLFNSQPSLTRHAPQPVTRRPPVQPRRLRTPLTELLQIAPATPLHRNLPLRHLVDVARQAMANRSRRLLPLIKQAYESKDKAAFTSLTNNGSTTWSCKTTSSNQPVLPSRPMLSFRPTWASSPAELDRLNYDARSILTTLGDRHAASTAPRVRNRDWASLDQRTTTCPAGRCFDSLSTSSPPANPKEHRLVCFWRQMESQPEKHTT